jgi:hypothetical protein
LRPETLSAASTETVAHAAGDVLLSIAEGDPERQPSEGMVAHVFSCELCSGNLRELRAGLAGLAARPGARPEPGSLGDEPSAMLDALRDDGEDDVARARKLIWKVAILGIVLAIGLVYLRGFAAGMR